MAISTKNVKTIDPTGLKPVISPGNHQIKILSIELRKDKNWEKYGDSLVLKVATPPIEGFKGLPIEKTKPELGNHPGQVGFVRYSRWNFRDDVLDNGTEIVRVDEILRALKHICEELNISAWFDSADSKYETIEEFVEGFNKEAPFAGIFFHAAIYGKEFLNGAYLNHDLFLPKFDRTLGKPFSLNPEKVIKFFESVGIERLKSITSPKPETTSKPAEIPKSSDTQSNADWLEEINKPVEQIYHANKEPDPTQPTKIVPSSQQEADFLNAGPQSTNTPITDGILKEGSVEEAMKEEDPNRMPWDN